MHNSRFRLMTGLAGATLCLFAVTGYGQNPNTTTGTAGTGSASTQTGAGTTQPGTPTGAATAPATTDAGTANGTISRSTASDVTTTTTTTRSFPGGLIGILAVALIVVLLLVALFRGRDRTVIRETYASSSTAAPGGRDVGTGTAADDRMNLNSRAASGPGNTSGMNDPNTRR